MPNEVTANQVSANEVLAPLPDGAPSERDYQAFCAALEASARGRAFLAEYARRNRHANTEMLLLALDRLATVVRSQTATTDADRLRQELRALLAAMRAAQPAGDADAAAIRAARLAALIAFVQHRIESMVTPEREQSPLPAEVAALALPDEATAEAARAHLAVVPRADEPELPIPSPAGAQTPAMALVTGIMPQVNLIDAAAAKSIVSRPAAGVGVIIEKQRVWIPPQAGNEPSEVASPPADPLAAIMALSEAERIALFS